LEGPIGAFNDYNGRVSQIKITGAAGYSVYAGTCAGGLWRWTYDDYASNGDQVVWRSLGDGLPNPSVRSFDVDPTNENHILVGTGEVQRYVGIGMFVTTNGGGQWNPVTLPPAVGTPSRFSKIEFAPSSGLNVLAASTNGLLHSPDGGASWNRVLTNICYDFVWDPSGADLAYAISENGANDTVWRGTNGGTTWNALPAPPAGNFSNARISICRDQPGTVVIVTVDDTALTPPLNVGRNINSVARSTNANTATEGNVVWTDITNVQAGGANDPIDIGGQAFHALAIAVKPDDANTILVGAGGQAITTDGGATWQTQGNGNLDYTHADLTSFYFGRFGGAWDDLVWICNDGGMFIDDISGDFTAAHFQGDASTGIAISQVDYSDADRDMIAIGLQDNGVLTRRGNQGDPVFVPWTQADPGESDGTEVTIIDAEIGTFWYCDGVYATPSWRIFANNSAAPTNNLDPGVWGLRMYHDVWNSLMFSFETVNVTSIPTGNIAAGWSTAVTLPAQLRDVWGSTVDGNTLFVTYFPATNNRDLSVCRKSGATWNVTTTNNFAPASGVIESVTPSYRWSDECWVALRSPIGSAKVIHMLPDGTTEDISGNLSNLNVVHSVAVTPFNSDILYAATDIGMFQTLDGGATWTPYMTDLPVCQCRELQWVANDSAGWSHELVVATFGRGVFSRTISAPPLIYVNEDATGSEDGSFEHPYQTLTAAVDAAPSGAIIAIHADTYSEAQTITKNVRLETWAGQTVIK
ncbi:MAG: hypothetical protein CL933_01010, partial [Deltaproteobacteria bacterium]|nr:hypothetical protein [Deltaproteobacteria bacterium]